jgi:hypothetical protein
MYFQWRKEWTTPAVGVVSFAAGAAAGYFYMRRQADILVDTAVEITHELDDLTLDIETMNPFVEPLKAYQTMVDDFTRAVQQLAEARQTVFQEEPPVDAEHHPEIVRPPVTDLKVEDIGATLSAITDDGWSYEEEQKDRTPDAPYVIHRDEFFNRETGYHQNTLQWYVGDKILCDENDVPIYAPEKVVGQLRFGHGSGDPNVVYVRNEKLSAEYEIVRNEGLYQIEVLGIEVEEQADADDLKHSQTIRRFRMD